MLGNGQLTVGLNEQGLVHDFYYPYVGLENLSTARATHHKIGIWVDGQFSWVDDGSWTISVNFESDALVSNIRMQHFGLKIELLFFDFVDHEYNAFCRQVTVTNHAPEQRTIRLFTHQVFEISRRGRADTALFVPEENYILDYKGRYSLLIYGQDNKGTVFDQFAVGNYGIEGKEGTYKDAEDGELSGSAVEHGGVDSVMRFSCELGSEASTQIYYWIIAADSQYAAEQIHHVLKEQKLDQRLMATRRYWHDWLSIASNGLQTIETNYQSIVKKSLMIVKVHTDRRGGIIASCDSSIYNYGRDYYSYVWPRDGAYAIWPLIRLGYQEEPKRFFEFCRDILTKDGYLMHKYQPDRAIGSTWHPLLHGRHSELAIQEDETAIVIYMLSEYLTHTQDEDFVFSLYTTLIQPACNFMTRFIDEQTRLPHASYDLWEEKFLTSTYTMAVVYRALMVAAELADKFQYPDDAVAWKDAASAILDGLGAFYDNDRGIYRKGFLLREDGSLEFDNTLDVSNLYGPMMFGGKDFASDMIENTLKALDATLLNCTPSGGAPRYEHDQYFAVDPKYMGNPWFVTTLWMAQYYARNGQPDKGHELVDWTIQHTLPSGVLSEQVNPESGAPLSVTPLVWSHAELINTILDIAKLG
jgi:GH15 family glucan-1,4-alpha-glucosidase